MDITCGSTALKTVVADITTLAVDAIVNAANSSLMGGGGVDGAIHHAGGPDILQECKDIVHKKGRLPTGEAVITTAGRMPAGHVIHTVGPVWHGGKSREPVLLGNCYRNSLQVAQENGLRRIAFPSISTGIYSYPAHEAADVAVRAVIETIEANPGDFDEIIFCGFDEGTEGEYARALRAANL